MFSAPRDGKYSAGIEFARGLFALWVLFAHCLPWAQQVDSSRFIPTFLVDAGKWLIFTFQTRGEVHPAVLSFIVLSGYCIHRNGFRAGSFDIKKIFY